MAATYETRIATVADVDGIFRVRTAVVHNQMTEDELAGIGITRATVAAMLVDDNVRAWCVDIDGQVAGFSLAERDAREVDALFVAPEAAGKGIGSLLLDAAIAWLREVGDTPIRLKTDPGAPAYDFYLRRGWSDTGEVSTTSFRGEDRYLVYEFEGL